MSTTVQCPSCSTSFPVDPAKVPERGVHARCSVCASVFFVAKPSQLDDDATAVEPTPGEVAAPDADLEAGDDWVIEREPDLDRVSFDVEPVDTVERAQEGFVGTPGDDIEHTAPPTPGAGDMAAVEAGEDVEHAQGDVGVEAGAGDLAASSTTGFQFGRRDPHEKAQRLARVLVSDMITYNPERHARALEGGTLPQDFEDEIRKSWEEYVDQVGDEIARGTAYFSSALNEILARGDQIFSGSPPSA